MSLDDPRVEWMRDRVCLGLNVTEQVRLIVAVACSHFIVFGFANFNAATGRDGENPDTSIGGLYCIILLINIIRSN